MAPAVPNNLQKERRILSLQPGSAAGAAAAAAVAAEQPAAAGAERHGDKKAAFTLRRYRPSDHPQVVEICHNVYGGTDILPDRIIHDAARPDTHVLVAALPHDDSVAALLCCQQRGDVLWLYGARTREDMRRRGLAELLLAEAEALARSLPGVAALLSVTVPANGTMRRIFARRGLCQLCQVVSWPPYAVAREVHGQLTRAPAAGEEAARRPASLLDALPNAAALLQNGPAARLLPLWRRCETRSELEAALLQLRQPRMGAVGEAAGDPQAPGAADQQPCAASNALHWLPEEFDLLPAGSAQAEALVRQGQVWLLPAGAVAAASGEAAVQMQDEQRQAGGQHDMPAVLVLHGPGVWGMQHAGVVAASQAALESALLLAAEVEPHCCCLYVDCCERFDHDALWHSVEGNRLDVLPHWKKLL